MKEFCSRKVNTHDLSILRKSQKTRQVQLELQSYLPIIYQISVKRIIVCQKQDQVAMEDLMLKSLCFLVPSAEDHGTEKAGKIEGKPVRAECG